jgi:hypothetical protein
MGLIIERDIQHATAIARRSFFATILVSICSALATNILRLRTHARCTFFTAVLVRYSLTLILFALTRSACPHKKKLIKTKDP